jgi:hypothetical protein
VKKTYTIRISQVCACCEEYTTPILFTYKRHKKETWYVIFFAKAKSDFRKIEKWTSFSIGAAEFSSRQMSVESNSLTHNP